MGRLDTGQNTMEISLFLSVEDLYVYQHTFELKNFWWLNR